MRIPAFVATLIFLVLSNTCLADTFIVTRNAESGPGSLREAILLANANGSVTRDYIHFNLPDQSRNGRTITLNTTGLPELGSNLQIDGTTQPGPPFGYSDARVIILVNTRQPALLNIFTMDNVSDINIGGLFLMNTIFNMFYPGGSPVYGFNLYKSKNITIGSPGKGNYFRGLNEVVVSTNRVEADRLLINCENIIFQSNQVGIDEAGIPSVYYPSQANTGFGVVPPSEYILRTTNAKNILIGGNTAAEGNSIAGGNVFAETNKPTDNGNFIFKNNKAGLAQDGSIPPNISTSKLSITVRNVQFYDNYKNDYVVNIIDNKISAKILLRGIGAPFTIQGNTLFFDTDNGSWSGTDRETKLQIEECYGGGIIGGETAAEQNTFFNTSSVYGFGDGLNYISTGAIFVRLSPKVLIVKNTVYCTANYGAAIRVESSGQPYCQVDYTATGFVRGKATPNSKIEVFQDDDCKACEGIALLGETTSDANGDWSFTGNFTGVALAIATKDGSSSGYTEPTFDLNNTKITHPTCGEKNGSVKGIRLEHSVDGVEWRVAYFDENNLYRDSLFSRDPELVNAGPGTYYFVAKLGATCYSRKITYTLKNYTPEINEAQVSVVQPSCGKNNGLIRGLYLKEHDDYRRTIYRWEDMNGNVLFNGVTDYTFNELHDVGPGSYRLIVTDTAAGCADTTSWFNLSNAAGPSIDDENLVISAATCGQDNGGISGLSYSNAQGFLYMAWVNEQNEVVSNSIDLTNQPAGKYRFRFKDQGGCDTLITPYFSIPSSGVITISEQSKNITEAGCTLSNGAISGINVTGASTYTWTAIPSMTDMGNTVDVSGLPTGNYQLTATNNFGCSLQSSVINIPTSKIADIVPDKTWIIDGNCSTDNAWLRLEGFKNEQALQSYYWINSNTSQELGSSLSLTGLGAGTYEFIATDTNGCKGTIFKATVKINPKPVVNTSNVVITNDNCNLNNGQIQGISISGLLGPTEYRWIRLPGMPLTSDYSELAAVGQGSYLLTVKDNLTCEFSIGPFTIQNSEIITQPKYADVTITRYSSAVLKVSNHMNGIYSLYADAAGTQLLEQNVTGEFTTPVVAEDKIFYIKYQNGTCISQSVPVKITVIDKSMFAIPKAFTPNNDGLNDHIVLRVLGLAEVDYFRIFNRNGEEVFSSKQIGQSWDGRWKGQLQPGGVYVWMAQGKDINGVTVKDKGTITLIR